MVAQCDSTRANSADTEVLTECHFYQITTTNDTRHGIGGMKHNGLENSNCD
jgi:hypothetical protein